MYASQDSASAKSGTSSMGEPIDRPVAVGYQQGGSRGREPTMDPAVPIDQEHARQPATQGAERLSRADLDDQQLGLLVPQARVGLGTRHQGWIARWLSGQEPDNQRRPPRVA